MARNPRSERPGRPRARLFLALDLPEPERTRLSEWRDELVAGRDDLRPVRPEALHVTLVFLGWQFERDVDRIAEIAGGAAAGMAAAHMTPTGVRAVPPRAPRLFALDLEDQDGRAAEVQAALSGALEEERLYRPEKRPFWPHLTLARVKRGRRAPGLDALQLPGPVEGGTVTLYRSTLRPQGAVYDALARTELTRPVA